MFAYLDENQQSFRVRRTADTFMLESVQADDGRRLNVYTTGPEDGPTCLLLAPLGVSCLFLMNVARSLAPRHRVITWEWRGLPDYYESSGDDAEWHPSRHLRDVDAILSATKVVRPELLLSYCSGAYPALFAIAHERLSPRRLCLVSPPVDVRGGGERTLYQRSFLPLIPRIARGGTAMAAVVRGILRRGAAPELEGVDAELRILNDLPFARDEHTHRYACLHAPWLEVRWPELLSRISVPTAILHGVADDIVHVDSARAVAAALPEARFSLYDGEGHFAIFTSARLAEDVLAFSSR